MKSNIHLHLNAGCTILAADGPHEAGGSGYNGGRYDYPEPRTAWDAYQDFGHNHWKNSLIWGIELHDISITGAGLIWGKGLDPGYTDHPLPDGSANKAIAFKLCRNVLLRDFSLLEGGHFGILLTGVDNATIDNLLIDTNRDGMDIDCCRNVRVSNCTVNSPVDDAICPKSSFALGYARITENLTITNCFTTGKYKVGALLDGSFRIEAAPANREKLGTGRIKCGTESNGGFRNITISNCICEGSRGLALETSDGAVVEDIAISNITLRESTSGPLYLRLNKRMRGPAGVPIGKLRRISIDGIVSANSISMQPSILAGIPDAAIEDIRLSNLYFHQRGGADASMAALMPGEFEKNYPEPTAMGHLPAHGLYLRHIRDLDISHVDFATEATDARPAIWAQDVTGFDLFRMKFPKSTAPRIVLKGVSDFSLTGSRGLPDRTQEIVDSLSI